MRQRLWSYDHDYIIYRDQLHQYSNQTTLTHHHTIMKQGLDYLVAQWVDHIICPPTTELHYQQDYPQIMPIFQQYISHTLQYSIVGKIGYLGSRIQCEAINLHWWTIASAHQPTSRQTTNHHYNIQLPIRINHDHHLMQRLIDHNPKHYQCNTIIKQLLKPLKDAAVDTVIWLDWAYYACDVSRAHHCRKIKRHRSDILKAIFDNFQVKSNNQYSISIHHTGTLHDLIHNKKIRRLLARGKQINIQQMLID